MQSWVLDFDFIRSASFLDRNRLHANIYENIHGLASLWNINDKLVNPKRNITNHPNVKRWKGLEASYCDYIACHLNGWKERGYNSEINKENYYIILSYAKEKGLVDKYTAVFQFPTWITEDFIINHRLILLQRNYKHYCKYFTNEGELK